MIVVPLIVMIFLFGQWFVEIVQIKLKVQESARYAAWEATAYPLHDYDRGPDSLNESFGQMRVQVMADAVVRYADLDSSTTVPRGSAYMMASWRPPVVILSNQQEEAIYGGAIPNLIFNLVTGVGALAGALLYDSPNPYATALIGFSQAHGSGQGLTTLFGDTSWGFNRNGYVMATSMAAVKNEWFNVRVGGRRIFPRSTVLLTERHGVLADSWRLNQDGGDSVRGGRMFKQVERMYVGSERARNVAKTSSKFGSARQHRFWRLLVGRCPRSTM